MTLWFLARAKKEQELLLKMGIVNNEDVLRHLPRRYDDFSLTPKEKIYAFQNGEKGVFYGTLVGGIRQFRFATASKSTFYFRTSYGIDVFFTAWNRTFLNKVILPEEHYTLQGSYDEKNHTFNLLSVKRGNLQQQYIPVYSLPDDYPEHRFIHLVKHSLEMEIPSILSDRLHEKYILPLNHTAKEKQRNL